MKRNLIVTLIFILVSGGYIGMNANAFGSAKAEAKENSSNQANSVERITWEHAGEIGAPKGFEENIGTAGVLSGAYKNYVIVGGGANFPYETVLNGGVKQHYSDIYVFKRK